MKPEEITAKLCRAMPDAIVELRDLTGTQDHWQASIVSAAFEGKTMLQRHRLVMSTLAEEMKGPIHALTLELKAPDEV